MTTTYDPEVLARARAIAARAAIPLDQALGEAVIDLSYQRAQAAQVAAARAEAANPPAVFTFDHADLVDQLASAQLDAATDPQRVATKTTIRTRIEAQMRPLVAQRDELNRRIAALDAEWHDNL